MKVFLKETGSISVSGVEYNADENGVFEIPSEVFNHLVGENSHNIEMVLPELEVAKEEESDESQEQQQEQEKEEAPKPVHKKKK